MCVYKQHILDNNEASLEYSNSDNSLLQPILLS